MVYNRV